MSEEYLHAAAAMGTVITIQVIGHGTGKRERAGRDRAVGRALAWFRKVEAVCTRFDETSELRRLSATVGTPVRVSPILYHTLRFALIVAEKAGGAFDPTIGQRMEARGFNREYRTGRSVRPAVKAKSTPSYRDVLVDPDTELVTLLRPLALDLGAVAKGFAVDLAARELQPFKNYSIDAGGDLYLSGYNAAGKPWSVGIRHPRDRQQLIRKLRLTDTAVCTSGDYERLSADGDHHLMDARTGRTSTTAASATVLAPSAMMADALATAAFVLGPRDGIPFLEDYGVGGLIVTPALEQFTTRDYGPE